MSNSGQSGPGAMTPQARNRALALFIALIVALEMAFVGVLFRPQIASLQRSIAARRQAAAERERNELVGVYEQATRLIAQREFEPEPPPVFSAFNPSSVKRRSDGEYEVVTYVEGVKRGQNQTSNCGIMVQLFRRSELNGGWSIGVSSESENGTPLSLDEIMRTFYHR